MNSCNGYNHDDSTTKIGICVSIIIVIIIQVIRSSHIVNR